MPQNSGTPMKKVDSPRSFEGVWISKKIHMDPRLTLTEKFLLAAIDNLDDGTGCFASNAYLSEFLGTTPTYVSNLISRLVGYGLIHETLVANKRKLFYAEKHRAVEDAKDRPMDGDADMIEEEVEVDADVDEVEIPKNHIGREMPTVKCSRQQSENIGIIFDFWNLYKGQRPWKSHVKLSYDMECSILDGLKHFSVEDMCSAISNYAKVLLDNSTFWNHVWSLSVFFSVKYGNLANSPKKWWQFLPDNFIWENYLIDKQSGDVDDSIGAVDDGLIWLYDAILKEFREVSNNSKFEPSSKQKPKFIKAVHSAYEFFKDSGISRNNWAKHLFSCLNNVYLEKGSPIFPGCLCSETTWQVLMPQYMIELGVGQ